MMKLQIDKSTKRITGWVYEGKISGGIDYTGAIPENFDAEGVYYTLEDGALIYHDDWKQSALQRLAAETEMAELTDWFDWYDRQVAQYNRCVRLGLEFDQDMAALDAQATEKQQRIRELRDE